MSYFIFSDTTNLFPRDRLGNHFECDKREAMNSLKANSWGCRRERKGASKHKKRYVHPDAFYARTNIITTTIKVKTEFDVKR